ncbi:SHOCT domain-containing protein [Salinigranum marinum]|uniref:SHOCT domain-containing protein n=1 Tax=Salinigranum marinum TaxID=1515595 RepID=UPI002989D30F|nr:SHOCT domain-containing protein [Salinigranum marinum]
MTTTSTDRRLVTLALAALGVLVILPVLLVGGGMMGYMGYGPMMGGVQGGMWTDGGAAPGWLFLVGAAMRLLFLAVVVGAGYLLYRVATGRPDEDDALAELRLAYARGDLDDDEYERRREVLDRD